MKDKLQQAKTDITFVKKLPFFKDNKIVLIIDKQIDELYREKLRNHIKESPKYVLNVNEDNKTIDEIVKIFSFFVKNDVNRKTLIIAIGGGVTTDIAAFAAATFKRGCRLRLIPTTFLGMIDASIGGKCGINFQNYKNLVGTFYSAEKVIVYQDFLKTLPARELRNGWAECLKVALIENGELLRMISVNNSITDEIIRKAIEIKQSLCKVDLYDSSERRKLNLGHTFGHVLETISDFKISHGEAVAIGIRAAANLSLSKKLIDQKRYDQVIKLLDRFDFPLKFRYEGKNFYNRARSVLLQDKKFGDSPIAVLFKGKNVILEKVTIKEILETLQRFIS